jgi:hypothetical protein
VNLGVAALEGVDNVERYNCFQKYAKLARSTNLAGNQIEVRSDNLEPI